MTPVTSTGGTIQASSEKSSPEKASVEKPSVEIETAKQPTTLAVPTENNTVQEIKSYLNAKKISYTNSATKADLLKLINKGA